MRAVYDLGRCPLTYDFTHWLAATEAARIAAKEESIEVVFVYGDRDLTYRDQHFTPDRKAWRLHNLLVPLCRLLPSVSGYVVGGKGEQTISYKLADKIKPASILKCSRAAESVIAAWCRTDQPIVTITLRQSDLQVQRNSNFVEWLKVAVWLKDQGYCPVFVPDTEALMIGEPMDFGDFRICAPASMNPDLRLALYERAILNCFTSGGPFGLAMYAGLPFLLCKTIFPELNACSEDTQRRLGYAPEDWPGPYQRIFWMEDEAESVIQQLKIMLPECLKRERPMPEIYAFAVRKPERIKNIQLNFELNVPQLQQLPVHERVAALVCYGPSLKDTWRTLPTLGMDVYTVSGSHDFLLERGIVPKGHIECDPRLHKADFTKNADPRIEYLLASCCHPKVYENVLGKAPVQMWHAWDGDDVEAAITKLWPNAFTLLGGSNVGLRALAVLSAHGYRDFNIYGMDCSLAEGERHAGAHGGKVQPHFKVRPMGSDREFVTTRQLVSGAREAVHLISILSGRGFKFSITGDGLLLEMLRIATQDKKETVNA